jgi:hypothetical protein
MRRAAAKPLRGLKFREPWRSRVGETATSIALPVVRRRAGCDSACSLEGNATPAAFHQRAAGTVHQIPGAKLAGV